MGKSIQYMLGAASAVIIIAGLKLGADIVIPILFSVLLAICVAPLPEWLGRKGLSKGLSLAISIILIIGFGVLITYLLANSVSGLSDSLPVYEQKLTEYYNDVVQFAQSRNVDITRMTKHVNIAPEKIVAFATSITESLTNIVSNSIIIILLMLFIVVELVGYESGTRKGNRKKLSMHDWFVSLSGDLRKFISIDALEGLILGSMNFVFMLIMGVDFAFLWAFLSFFLNFIPNIGFVMSVIPPALIALITLGPVKALIVIAGYLLINFFVETVLNLLFMKKGLRISVLTSFLSMFVWGWILGMPGAFLGVPLTIVVMKIYNEAKGKQNDL